MSEQGSNSRENQSENGSRRSDQGWEAQHCDGEGCEDESSTNPKEGFQNPYAEIGDQSQGEVEPIFLHPPLPIFNVPVADSSPAAGVDIVTRAA